jgi:hypothetical protein
MRPSIRGAALVVVALVVCSWFAGPAVDAGVGGAADARDVETAGAGAAAAAGTGAAAVGNAGARAAAVPFDRADAGGHGVRIEGTITDDDGDPVEGAYVVVQPAGAGYLENATGGEHPVRRSLLELAEDPPLSVDVNRSVEGGEYIVHVPRAGDYDVIAVSEDGISELGSASIRLEGATENLTVDAHRVLSVEGDDASATPGDLAAVEVRLANPDDDPVRNLSIPVSVPEGWSVERVDADAAWDGERLAWERVPAGETATAILRVRVPEGTETGVYDVALRGDAAARFVEHGTARVRVAAPNATATPTLSPTPTEGDRFTFASPTSAAGGPAPLRLLAYGVFALGVAVSGYAVWRSR